MTKEEILLKMLGLSYFEDAMGFHNAIFEAMDECAKAFADWIRTEGWNNRNGCDWCRYETIYSDISVKTTEQLYDLFTESQSK